jgi:hypothetical protein
MNIYLKQIKNQTYFGFNEKLFAMVSEIGESLKPEEGSTA